MDATLTVDTSPFSQIDRRFFAVLFASMLVHAIAATWLARQPHVVVEEPAYAERPRARVTLPPLLKIPKNFPPLPPSRAPKPPSGSPGPGARPPGLSGLIAGAITDLNGQEGDIEAALRGARKGPVDTTLLASRRERGPNEVEAIGPIVTNGSQRVGIGEHVDAPARGKVEDVVIEDVPEVPDPSVFMKFINARRAGLAACYERELKYDRGLRGKVTVHLTVTPEGRTREVQVDQGSLHSPAVAGCIEALVRRWIFPVKPDDEVPLQFPVLFTPAQ